MKNLTTILLAVVLTVLSFSGLANEYLPYQQSDNVIFHSESAATTMRISEQTATGWRAFENFLGSGDVWLWSDESNAIYFWDEAAFSARLLVDFEADEGARFEASFTECVSSVVLSRKNLVLLTSIGKVQGVAELTFNGHCADAGIGRAFFAPGYGIVGYELNTIAGPRHYEVLSATIDGKVHEGIATNTNQLTFSADYSTAPVVSGQDQSVTAGLWVTNLGMREQTLYFNSGQRFDAMLIDAQGNRVALWSANKRFIQSMQTETLSAGESRFFGGELMLVDGNGQQLPSGVYQLQVQLMGSDVQGISETAKPPVMISLPLVIEDFRQLQ